MSTTIRAQYHIPSDLASDPSAVDPEMGGQLNAYDGIADFIVPDNTTLPNMVASKEYKNIIRPDEVKFIDPGPRGNSIVQGYERIMVKGGKFVPKGKGKGKGKCKGHKGY